MWAILVYSLASAVGQNFIYYMITQFGPLELTAVTTTRKIFTTLYSVFRNPANRLTKLQWVGCGLVFVRDCFASSQQRLKPARIHAIYKLLPSLLLHVLIRAGGHVVGSSRVGVQAS